MTDARVTVVVPTYNRAGLLRETIESVLAQTYSAFELLICDNASTDNTATMVGQLGDTRVRLHRHGTNIGMQRNWRFALTHPKTEYVALLSDDDLFLPHHLADGIRALDTNQAALMYACATETFGTGSSLYCMPDWARDRQDLVMVAPRDRYGVWLRGNPVASCSLLIRRKAFDEIEHWGGNNWPVSMDWLWWAQIAMGGALLYDPMVGTKYRWHETNYYKSWISRRHAASCENRYTIRYLANRALERGVLDADVLKQAVLDWPSNEAARLVTALLAPEAEASLRRIASELCREHPDLRVGKGSNHLRIARYVGSWYLRYADTLERSMAGWPPGDDR